tara:strand:+ start:1583 stop:1858 length:276 start_codon:yes stop_codon:yes gene_type:complete
MIYDPNNPISDEELDKIAEEDFDKFLEYLDAKTAYLKTKVRPLNSHEMKKFAALAAADEGRKISDEELERAKNIGKENEQKIRDNWKKLDT